jgi:uncharacterized protein YfcZ (UPF0381/DUF406 family)
MRISLFVEINRLTIEYTAWNSRRCNIIFTVWWSTYRKINACVRSQNDNNDNLDSTNVSISDVKLLLLECRREQRRSIIITRLSSRAATFNYYYSTIVENSDIEELRSTIVDDSHETERWVYQLMTKARKWYHQPQQSKSFLSVVSGFADERMSFDFNALFDLHHLIVCRISFFMMKNNDFKTTLK